jgi:hypothetical protein
VSCVGWQHRAIPVLGLVSGGSVCFDWTAVQWGLVLDFPLVTGTMICSKMRGQLSSQCF